MVCPKCNGAQNFTDWRNGIRRCGKDGCGGALFTHKHLWANVQKSFLDRWTEFGKKKEEKLAQIDKETMPPFKLLTRSVFNKETGEMEETAIDYRPWEECAEHFFERQQECLDKLDARRAIAEAEQKKMQTKVDAIALKANPYKFSKPLPDFYARQAAALEAKNMSFEERMAAMQG